MRLLVQLVIPYEQQRAKCIVATQIRKIAIDSANNNLIFRKKIPKIPDCVVHRRNPSIRHCNISFLLEKIIPRELVPHGGLFFEFGSNRKKKMGRHYASPVLFSHTV